MGSGELEDIHVHILDSSNRKKHGATITGNSLGREVNMSAEIKENDKEFVVEDMLVDDANVVMVHRS